MLNYVHSTQDNVIKMKPRLKEVSDIIAQANDQFYAKHSGIDTILGLIDKALRSQGMHADAVTIDVAGHDIKMVFLIHDHKPDSVDMALGNKAGDISHSSTIPNDTLSIHYVVQLMEQYFLQVNGEAIS